ncbi:hypothetical protein [Cellulosilyticum sp. I15G10I2]|uniref:hypothetical protein n=1 Tax=Cellulosilyticum sp. I15G10I2 TaxID=1892843 RepID=UPI00149568BC|nr:hypothetical protein [Cellulosilyticum sp. I15G10I2]
MIKIKISYVEQSEKEAALKALSQTLNVKKMSKEQKKGEYSNIYINAEIAV